MAVVQVVDMLKPENDGRRITRGMVVPKKVTSLEHWLKAARKAIPQIPNLSTGECIIEQHHATPKNITFHLRRANGTRVYVVIDRERDALSLR